jgi:hypothetical protein
VLKRIKRRFRRKLLRKSKLLSEINATKHQWLLTISFPFLQTATETVENLQMIQTKEAAATLLDVLAAESLQATAEGKTHLHTGPKEG